MATVLSKVLVALRPSVARRFPEPFVSAEACMMRDLLASWSSAEMIPHARSMGAHAVGQSVDLLQEPCTAICQPISPAPP